MGVYSYESEATSCIAPAKVFKAFILDADVLLPKVLPQAIKSCETIEGDGGPGSIRKISFVEGSKYEYLKHKVNVVDKVNLCYSYTIIEGKGMEEKIEKIEKHFKIEAKGDGGSAIKTVSKFYTIGDYEMKDEELNAAKEKALGVFKAFEAYLVANPDAY